MPLGMWYWYTRYMYLIYNDMYIVYVTLDTLYMDIGLIGAIGVSLWCRWIDYSWQVLKSHNQRYSPVHWRVWRVHPAYSEKGRFMDKHGRFQERSLLESNVLIHEPTFLAPREIVYICEAGRMMQWPELTLVMSVFGDGNLCAAIWWDHEVKPGHLSWYISVSAFIRPYLDGTQYGLALSVRPSVRQQYA